ncbi:UDP-4-amino-4,6-dideoxy-N-acetyl-beta-L-altrosamine N-acetyltransferase [Psychrobacillus psychrodurans]|uniref:UDP-4-amino-4, 6-dideoxy-N-acetyl-beta-L-altrosamine N-acetyltransferase n=1 Tax=Psychrobacillus psychrodurans TaxID=126157 RepID=A0A9X3L5J8_9BACI|nr:UDP-4-amino-4,6-dideoxy-N-acetyl-beta-L-altrosamine N-acetyltransferase [Psychrobacillus psychrodurans]MCZ8531802.1 UDP-4-amino-4,6-dideoxy-N-acetyl-beta-L-altrosamine N-acetyltransferase [Psychrobacillus psychrodurans]
MKWISIKEEHLQRILEWRTSEQITRFMYTDIEYNLENQTKWLEAIRQDANGRYFLMEYKNELVGYISITNIDWKHKHGHWNFYIGDSNYAMLAGFLGPYIYNYAFNEFGLEKLIGEVMDINESVRRLHVKQGARVVGVYEHHILKNGVWHDVYVFEMTKKSWKEVGQKFKKYVPEVGVNV